MADFDIKRYDLLPDLVLTVEDGGEPVDLSAAGSAKLIVSNRSGIKIESALTIEDQEESLGQVRYVWQAGDTDTVGSYNMEVEVMWAGQRPETFPAKGYLKLSIGKDLNSGPTGDES